jgi:HEAT repeat protein
VLIAGTTAISGVICNAEPNTTIQLPLSSVKGFIAAIKSSPEVRANAIFFWDALDGWKYLNGADRPIVVAALSKTAEAPSQVPILRARALDGLVKLNESAALSIAYSAIESTDKALRLSALTALAKWDPRGTAFRAFAHIEPNERIRLLAAAAEAGAPLNLDAISRLVDISELRRISFRLRTQLMPDLQTIAKAIPPPERLDFLDHFLVTRLPVDQLTALLREVPPDGASLWVQRTLNNRGSLYYATAAVATLGLGNLVEETQQRLARLISETDVSRRGNLIAIYRPLLQVDTPEGKKLRSALNDPVEVLNSQSQAERSKTLSRLIASGDEETAFDAISVRADRADLPLLLEFRPPDKEGSELERPTKALGAVATAADIPLIRSLLFKVLSSRVRITVVNALARLKAVDATDDVIRLLSESDDPDVQVAALAALGEFGSLKSPEVLLKYLNTGIDPSLTDAAAMAAGKLKLAAAIDPLIELLVKRSGGEAPDRILEALALLDVGNRSTKIVESVLQGCSCNLRDNVLAALPFALQQTSERERLVVRLLQMARERDVEIRPPIEAMAHIVGGAELAPEAMIRWLGAWRTTEPLPTDRAGAIEALHGIEAAWPAVQKLNEDFRRELARTIQDLSAAACTGGKERPSASTEPLNFLAKIFLPSDSKEVAACWQGADAATVWRIHELLVKAGNSNEASVLERQLGTSQWENWTISVFRWLLGAGGLWIVLWFGLICAYPRSRSIQSQVFWNDTLRKVAGFGFIDFLLRTIGPLRRLIARPFQSRLADAARLEEPFAFFDGIRAEDGQGRDLGRVVDVIPRLQGCLILVGESGLGKTTLLRWLTRKAVDQDRLVAFLDARRCAEGVYPALTKMVEGIVKEETFLRTLIHCRDLVVVIDGVNEVSPDTRARIIDFAVSHADADVLLATQPILWDSPLSLPERTLRPLSENDLEAFLLCFEEFLPEGAVVTGADYRKAVQAFVKDIQSQRDPEVRTHDLTIVSNPIDLTLVSELLASGEVPEPSRLDEQIFEKAEKKWNSLNQNAPFPLDDFAEYCFTQRKNDSRRIEDPRFNDLAAVLEQYRILIPRTEKVKDGSGTVDRTYHVFRHERLANFFMFHAFVGPHGHDRRAELISDGRFRSIYLMIADRATLPIAEETLGMLHDRALATKDFTVYADYYKRFVARPDVSVVVIGTKAA